jgi:hypothetical protein
VIDANRARAALYAWSGGALARLRDRHCPPWRA